MRNILRALLVLCAVMAFRAFGADIDRVAVDSERTMVVSPEAQKLEMDGVGLGGRLPEAAPAKYTKFELDDVGVVSLGSAPAKYSGYGGEESPSRE